MEKILKSKETYSIIGACMEVQRELGYGLTEPIYQEALAIELKSRKIPFEREKNLRTFYKGVLLDKMYKADFVCFDNIIVELKSVSGLCSEHESQLLNYMRLTKSKVGLLINFGTKSLEYKRFVI